MIINNRSSQEIAQSVNSLVQRVRANSLKKPNGISLDAVEVFAPKRIGSNTKRRLVLRSFDTTFSGQVQTIELYGRNNKSYSTMVEVNDKGKVEIYGCPLLKTPKSVLKYTEKLLSNVAAMY